MNQLAVGDKVTYVPNEKYHLHFGKQPATILEQHDGGYWIAFDNPILEPNCFLASNDEIVK